MLERKLVSKKELKTLGVPYSFAHIARLEKAGQFPKRVQLGQCRLNRMHFRHVSAWRKPSCV